MQSLSSKWHDSDCCCILTKPTQKGSLAAHACIIVCHRTNSVAHNQTLLYQFLTFDTKKRQLCINTCIINQYIRYVEEILCSWDSCAQSPSWSEGRQEGRSHSRRQNQEGRIPLVNKRQGGVWLPVPCLTRLAGCSLRPIGCHDEHWGLASRMQKSTQHLVPGNEFDFRFLGAWLAACKLVCN